MQWLYKQLIHCHREVQVLYKASRLSCLFGFYQKTKKLLIWISDMMDREVTLMNIDFLHKNKTQI